MSQEFPKERLNLSHESRTEYLAATPSSLNRQFELEKAEQDSLEWILSRETEEILFQFVNVFTRASRHPALAAESRYRLQRSGGQVIVMLH